MALLRRLAFAARLVALMAAVVVLVDALVFRSGFYLRWLEPQSVAGSTRNAVRRVEATVLPDRRNVLVVGNSKIGEGLSTALADATTAGSGLHFVNGFIPGSALRVWYYLLREIDPQANRFAAIVLAVPFGAEEDLGAMADRVADINYLAPLLGLRDLTTFPSSFEKPALSGQARRAILFPAQSLRRDIAALLASPLQRYGKVRDAEQKSVAEFLRYQGSNAALPDLPIDPATRLPARWDGVDDRMKRGLTEHYFRWLHVKPPPSVAASNERYYREWLTRIVQRYRSAGTPVILIEVPRGPWHGTETPPPQPTGAVAELIASGAVSALPGDTFVDIERPHNFFDLEHMNKSGRELFTVRLAQRVAALLH